jgi:transposase
VKQEVTMIKKDLWLQVKLLYQEGCSRTEIARRLAIDRKTVRKALKLEEPPDYTRARAGSKLDPYRDFIRQRINDGVTNVIKLRREIQRRGYQGSISILRDFTRPLRPAPPPEAFVRFETPPGDQAQVDWGELWGVDLAGRKHRVYCFTMVLGYSRCLYAELTEHMDLTTLLRCHINAFDYFGGITRTILYDNMKQVILRRDEETHKLRFNTRFLDFARYCSFAPRLCRPMRPQTKGKVESAVKYVKGNFWPGEIYLGLGCSNAELRVWLDTVANVRIHATTREKPFDRMKLERPTLISLPSVPYDTSLVTARGATRDCLISYQGNRYSVPYQYSCKALTVRDAGTGQIRIYALDRLIATHELSLEKGRVIRNPAHMEGFKPRRDTTPHRVTTWREQRSAPVRVGSILQEVLDAIIPVEERALTVYEQAAEEDSLASERS